MYTPSRQNTQRSLELESLKGLMAFVIAFFQHYRWLLSCTQPIPHLSFLYFKGYYFVETFFVLSGYGMSIGYEKKLKEIEDISVFSFLRIRMRKLFPIMTSALIVTTLLQIFYHFKFGKWYWVSEVTVYSFVMSFLNISSGWFIGDNNLNMPLWYISALMLCYVIFYCICRISRRRKELYIFLITAFYCWALSIVITTKHSDHPFMYYNVARGYACFFVGILLKEFIDYINVEKARNWVGVFSFAFFTFIMGSCFVFHSETKILASSQLLSQMVWGNILSPLLILSCLFFKPLSRILRIKPLVFLGSISTSLYIWHFPLYNLLQFLPQKFYAQRSSLPFYAFVILFMLFFSTLTRKCIEPKLNNFTESLLHKTHRDTYI